MAKAISILFKSQKRAVKPAAKNIQVKTAVLSMYILSSLE